MFVNDLFKQKVVVVTGGSAGVGWITAEAFAELGAEVFILDVNQPGINSHAKIRWIECDLADQEQLQNAYSTIEVSHNRIDVLINTARGPRSKLGLEETSDSFQQVTEVAIKGPLLFSQMMIKMPTTQQTMRTIVNVSSVSGQSVSAESSAYHIAKSGLESMTRFLSVQGGRYGVRVNAVAPGFIVADEHKPRFENEDNKNYRQLAQACHPLNEVGSNDDVVNAILFLASPLANFVNGQTLVVDGGLNLRDGWHQVNSVLQDVQQGGSVK